MRRYEQVEHAPRMVVQLLDDEVADLAVLRGPDDFLISPALGGQFIAQLIEQPERRAALLALYGGDDASIRMIRCDRMGLVGTFTMNELVTAAFEAGVLAIGWRRTADGSVVLNADGFTDHDRRADQHRHRQHRHVPRRHLLPHGRLRDAATIHRQREQLT